MPSGTITAQRATPAKRSGRSQPDLYVRIQSRIGTHLRAIEPNRANEFAIIHLTTHETSRCDVITSHHRPSSAPRKAFCRARMRSRRKRSAQKKPPDEERREARRVARQIGAGALPLFLQQRAWSGHPPTAEKRQ